MLLPLARRPGGAERRRQLLVLAQVVGAVVGRLRAASEGGGREERGRDDGGAGQRGKAKRGKHGRDLLESEGMLLLEKILASSADDNCVRGEHIIYGIRAIEQGQHRAARPRFASRRSCPPLARNGRAPASPASAHCRQPRWTNW